MEIADARDDDLEELAALVNRSATIAERYTARGLRAAARRDPLQRHIVARAEGRIVGGGLGYGGGVWTQPDRALMVPALLVEEGQRRRGIGSAIAERLEAHAWALDAARVVTSIRSDQDAGLAFAASRGYREFHREANARLDVARWDAARFGELLAAPIGGTTAVVTLRDALACEPGRARDIAGAIRLAHLELLSDLPRGEITFPIPEADAYERDVLQALDPDASLVALRGDEVLAVVLTRRFGGLARIVVAGEVASGRGRKLMIALKARAIAALRREGVAELRSVFDRDNAMTRQLNRSLGFEPLPPLVRLELPRPR